MIIRGPRPTDALVLIQSAALADGTLSFKARGILAYLLSLPPGADISPDRITKSGTDGERAVKSGIKELQDAGYLYAVATPDEDNPTIQLMVSDTKGVEAPTPQIVAAPMDGTDHLLWLSTQHPWLSHQAVKTAHREIELQDLALSVTRYEIRCKERNTTPKSGEWLRWLIDDEEKLRIAEKERAREAGQHKPWYATA